jgi:hypothetical protein
MTSKANQQAIDFIIGFFIGLNDANFRDEVNHEAMYNKARLFVKPYIELIEEKD